VSLDRGLTDLPDCAGPVLRMVPMRRRHLRAVMRIDEQVYPRPWTLALYQGELAQAEHRRIYLVARAGREVVGHAGLTVVAGEGHVTTVAVDPGWQARGVGTRLMLVLARAALGRGLTAMTLEVRASNVTAQRLYERFGFVAAGVRAGYYAETGEDAVIMWAHHVDDPAYRRRLEVIESQLVGPPPIDEISGAIPSGDRLTSGDRS
jgi:[ribosomal protein S18]-alanine N-acetyltransferase